MILLSTLYVTSHSVKVGVSKGSIEVREKGRLAGRFPMAELRSIVVTSGASFSTQALAHCVDRGIGVAFLHGGGGLRFVVGGPVDGSVLLRVAQVRAADHPEQAGRLARQFVRGKLANQARLMRRWADAAEGVDAHTIEASIDVLKDRIDTLGQTTDGDRIRGIEGDSARRYFKAMGLHLRRVAHPPFEFVRRTRRPPRDPVNALFGYLYGLVVARASGALQAVGLDPQIGYLHCLRPGRPSLALDLAEEFRPLSDRFAVRLITRRELTEADFLIAGGGACYLTDEGRRKLLGRWDAYEGEVVDHPLLHQPVPRGLLIAVQATLLARTLRGDVATYPPLVME